MPAAEHSHVSSVHGNSPGRANSRLNYTLDERAVHVRVLDKVKEARQDTITKYHADYLGLRGTQFNPSTVVTPSIIGKTKYSRTASDLVLAHELAPKHLSAKDCRTLSPDRVATWDRHTYHAFTRGDVITGWNHSTATGPRELKQWLSALDTTSQRHTAAAKHKLDASGVQLPTLRQREKAFAGALRDVKEAAAEQHRQLEARFGAEGAAMMESILAMKQPERKAVIRATRADLEEVEALPAMGLMED